MRRLGAGLLLVALLGAACSDTSEEGSDDGAATETTVAAPETTVALEGEPVVVGAIVEENLDEVRTESHAAADAAVAAINAAGGIGGRPLEVRFCDPPVDPNAVTACARDFADDPEVVAIVGFVSTGSQGAQAILAEEGIASIGNSPITGADFNCPVCFPVGAGSVGGIAGQATLIADELGDDVAMILADTPAGQSLPPLISLVLATRGSAARLGTVVPTPDPGADVSAQVAAASEGDPSGIAIVTSHDTSLGIFQTAASQGVEVPMVYTTANLTDQDLELLGDTIDGLYLASQFRLSGPAVDEFEAVMAEHAPDEPLNEAAKTMWIAVHLFADLAQGLATIDRPSVLTAMGQLSGYETGFTPPLDFTVEFDGLGGALPRLFNTSVVYAQVADGEIVELNDGEFVDVFDLST